MLNAGDQDTVLAFKKIGLVRMMKNDFAFRAMKAENEGWNEISIDENYLATKRERAGIFEGDLIEGELEAGQGVGLINDIPTVKDLFERLLKEFEKANERIKNNSDLRDETDLADIS